MSPLIKRAGAGHWWDVRLRSNSHARSNFHVIALPTARNIDRIAQGYIAFEGRIGPFQILNAHPEIKDLHWRHSEEKNYQKVFIFK